MQIVIRGSKNKYLKHVQYDTKGTVIDREFVVEIRRCSKCTSGGCGANRERVYEEYSGVREKL